LRRGEIVIRHGKGGRDRVTMVPLMGNRTGRPTCAVPCTLGTRPGRGIVLPSFSSNVWRYHWY